MPKKNDLRVTYRMLIASYYAEPIMTESSTAPRPRGLTLYAIQDGCVSELFGTIHVPFAYVSIPPLAVGDPDPSPRMVWRNDGHNPIELHYLPSVEEWEREHIVTMLQDPPAGGISYAVKTIEYVEDDSHAQTAEEE